MFRHGAAVRSVETRDPPGFCWVRVVRRDGGGKDVDVDAWKGKRIAYGEPPAVGNRGTSSRW